MEINKIEEKLDHADSFLTKLKTILKKHWGILSLLLVGYFFYWAFTTDFEEEAEEPKVEQVTPVEHKEGSEYKIIKETYIIDDYGYRIGDTVYIDEYDDGYIEKYYTDGESYIDDYPKQ